MFSCSVMPSSLQGHELWPASLLCLWDFKGKNAGVSSHSLLQGIFPTQESNPGLLHYRQILYPLSHQGSLSLLVYRKTIYFCIWICILQLYWIYFSSVQFSHSVMSDFLQPHGLQHAWLPCPSPTPGVYSNSRPWSWWLNFFTSSNKFLVETSGIFLLEYHVICKLWHVYFFSSSLDVFYFFSCYWARTSNIVLSRRDNSGFPWLVPDFRGKAFSFSPLSLMLLVSLVYMAFIVFKHVPFMPSLTEKKFYTSFLVSSSSDIFFLIVESDWK